MFTLEQKINICLEFVATDDLDRLEELSKLAAEALADPESTTSIAPATTYNDIPTIDLDDMIDDFLTELGCPCNIRGYDALAYSIKLVAQDKTYLHQITKRLYWDTAKHFNTTESRVERRMRHAVERIFDVGDASTVQDVFGNTIRVDSGSMPNSEFIAAAAKEIRRRAKHAGVTI